MKPNTFTEEGMKRNTLFMQHIVRTFQTNVTKYLYLCFQETIPGETSFGKCSHCINILYLFKDLIIF